MLSSRSREVRLRIHLRRENHVWIRVRGQSRLYFGWILSIPDGIRLVFKDEARSRPLTLRVDDIESCGTV